MSERFWQEWREALHGIWHHQDERPLSGCDLRQGLPRLALPDESEHLAGGTAPKEDEPEIVAPGPHGQIEGSSVHG